MTFFDTNSFGKIINRFSQDTFVLDWELPLAMLNTSLEALVLVGSVVLISVSVPYILIVFFFAAILFYYMRKFYAVRRLSLYLPACAHPIASMQYTSRMLRRLDMGSKSPLYSLFGET
ncbi:hypothetical protein BT69DRAFT_1338383 [Atractiella rhizophila]|nr:hypothetical protein BT69DRAFT_1338383 [Atractiella rhizophila]